MQTVSSRSFFWVTESACGNESGLKNGWGVFTTQRAKQGSRTRDMTVQRQNLECPRKSLLVLCNPYKQVWSPWNFRYRKGGFHGKCFASRVSKPFHSRGNKLKGWFCKRAFLAMCPRSGLGGPGISKIIALFCQGSTAAKDVFEKMSVQGNICQNRPFGSHPLATPRSDLESSQNVAKQAESDESNCHRKNGNYFGSGGGNEILHITMQL